MKALFRTVALILAALGGALSVKGQHVPSTPAVGIYGSESKADNEFRLTLMKPDTLQVDCVLLMAGKDVFIFPAKTWVDPTDGSPSEEININVPLYTIDFTDPVVVRLVHKKRVVSSYRLETRSPYGNDYLDFFGKVNR